MKSKVKYYNFLFVFSYFRAFVLKNIRYTNIIRIQFLAAAFLFLISPTLVFADEKKTAKPNEFFLISMESVQYKQKQNQNILLIDVRSKSEYEKFKIPGSMNIPLYSIKTKSHLKSQTLVLINEGYALNQLEETCIRLKESGYSPRILKGGLNYWKNNGGEIEGDLFAQKEINKVTPQEFYQEKGYDGHQVVDASGEQSKEAKEMIPNATHLSNSDEKSLCSLDLCESKKIKHLSVLFFNEDGRGYEKIEKMIEDAGVKSAFFLKGGLNGYRQFLSNLKLSHAPRESRVKTVSKCRKCEQNEDKD